MGKTRKNGRDSSGQHGFSKSPNNRLTTITLAKVINIQPPSLKSLEEWVKEEQGKHFCVCGCGNPVKIRLQHRAKGIPKYMHGHHTMAMTRLVGEYNKKGFYTIGQVFKMTGIGQTTIRRHQGKLFPEPARIVHRNKTRLYTKAQIEQIRNLWRDNLSPAPASADTRG